MLFFKNRLRKKKDFERVMKDKTSKSAAVSFLATKFSHNGAEDTRIGFVVSKKISKKAVVRNKIKRRLRESAREIIPNLISGYDIVIFTMPGITNSDFDGIKKALETLFQKSGLWQKKL